MVADWLWLPIAGSISANHNAASPGYGYELARRLLFSQQSITIANSIANLYYVIVLVWRVFSLERICCVVLII